MLNYSVAELRFNFYRIVICLEEGLEILNHFDPCMFI